MLYMSQTGLSYPPLFAVIKVHNKQKRTSVIEHFKIYSSKNKSNNVSNGHINGLQKYLYIYIYILF